ncbi:DUF3035 domain-containing protein [Roseovarius tibetensis]|uniref:DUF3035 domain-containing protein n=1 Tax=Roseovarius tibetensis TaxID=2685897 RepID=UPI003D7FE5F7
MSMPRKSVLILLAATIVAGCAARDGDVTLTRIGNTGNGPDEFSVLPGKPLQPPEDPSRLPAPVPGATSRTDQNPLADGAAALGGNRSAPDATPDARDAALVGHATRFGGTQAIRQTLAEEDRETRRRHGRVNILGILPGDDYVQAYRQQWLNAYAEERRLRNRGILTPASPPAPTR